jgi:hypothetical protein
MALHDYHLVTRWVSSGTLDDIAALLRDTAGLARWFPAVVRDVDIVRPGDASGLGQVVALRVKGWMPHTLSFCFRVVDVRHPTGFTLEVWGDFEGRLVCQAVEEGSQVLIYFDWRVRVQKPFVRHFTWLLRPFFVSNHRWVVARGEESLDLELRRRRGSRAGEIPPPPGPTFPDGALKAYVTSRIWPLADLLPRIPERVRDV